MIKIYDINDNVLMQVEVSSAAKREQEMSKSDYISLSFSAAEKVILPVGAYINYKYKIDKVREVTRKFLLLEAYEPMQSDEMSWKYEPQFQHPKMILSKTPFFIHTHNSKNEEIKQNVWSFVGTTSVLSKKIEDFLNNDLKFGNQGWKVVMQSVTANTVNVSFSDNDFISALTAIANAIGDNCEWHIDYDDEFIYIGKVIIGSTPYALEVGKNVGVPSVSNSKEDYYNAFSIFGGTRNITQVNSKGENISSGDVRLQLSEGKGTISIDGKEHSYTIDKFSTLDLRENKDTEPLFTKVLDFTDIFPSLNTYVYNVRGREKYVLTDGKKIPLTYNTDGSVKEYKTFTVWYMRLAYPSAEKIVGKEIINTTVDDGVTHYWYDFEITDDLLVNGKNIGCSFEANFNTDALSTPLAGRGSNGDYVGFELTYHKEAESSRTGDDVSSESFSILKGDYEIIYQEDNDVIVPTNASEMLIPHGEDKPSLKCNITVLYNIAMADSIYYFDAQQRLLDKAEKEIVRLLSDLNNYTVKSYPQEFLQENPQLQIGQSVTYKDGHGYELDTRVLKLSTNIDYDIVQEITVGNQAIKGTITQLKEDVQTIIASGGSNGNGNSYTVAQIRSMIARYGNDNFLSKQFNDAAQGLISFLRGLKVGNYNGENGGSWTPDSDGRSHLVTDYLEVRMKAIFEELVIKKTSTIGGKEIISPAGGVVAHKVDEVTVTYKEVSQQAYRCYFLAEQDGDEVDNDFALEDQVRSESFNVKKGKYHKVGNHFLWRLVIGRDEEPVEIEGKKYHYIDLSVTDCATASDAPMNGDVLSQCGNRSDKERQNCLIFSSVDTFSPSITLYHGINSYSFANKEYVEYGVNKQTNKAFFNVYGDMYVGDRPTKENNYEGSSYIKYDSESKKVTIKAELSVGSTFDGKTLEQQIKDNAPKGLSEGDVNTIINNSQVISDLQNQIDGAIETWFYDGVPTLTNAPAKDWTTDKDKNIHLGDLYYDNKTGKAYRFAKDGSTYKWTVITDTDITKALDNAAKAQETADGKMTVFSSQPKPPYQVGDIWVNATYGNTYKNDVLRCKTTKTSGSFSIDDWMLASKYTDDTVANAAKKAAEDAQKSIKATQENLTTLTGTVNTNKKAFDEFTVDGYLDSSEIAAIAQDSKRLQDDFAAAEKSYNEVKDSSVLAKTTQLTNLVTAYGTTTSGLLGAKTELVNYLSDIVTRYNSADFDGKKTINSRVATLYDNFQKAYETFYNALGLANAYITSTIYSKLGIVIGDVASYQYLKDALGKDAKTDINGGLILSSLIALRDPKTGYVQSGLNGIVDSTAKGNGIATWWGGYMNDGSVVGFDKKDDITKQAATSLVRFDGSGYLANGSIYWGTDGKVHADPTSFIISEKNLGAYLAFFEPTWKQGSDGSSVSDLVSLTPQAPFTKLGVSGDLNVEGKVTINGVTITYDANNKALKIDGSIYATGGISAYGDSGNEGGGGLNASVLSYENILAGSYDDSDLSHIPNAYAIKALSSRIDNISTELSGLNLDWSNITGKPSTFTPSAHTHKWADITDHPTSLSQFTNDEGFTDNKGTVTSIAMTVPTGLSVTGSPITTSGTLAVSFANGYSIPTTTKQGQWDTAYTQRHTHSNKTVLDGITSTLVANWNTAYTNNHTHSNKSVLDGISSTKVSHWDSAYNWYALMTTDETEADGVINKWNEVVSFLANIAQTDTLSGIIDGINKSISDEATRAKGVESTLNTNINTEVARAKGAESTLSSSISSNKTSITTLQGYFTSGSANSAVKLKTTRTLWGRSFDGSANVSGNLSSVGNITSLKSDTYSIGSSDNIFAKIYAHRIVTPASTALYLATAGVDRMMINSGGLVGMGTTSPAEKLHVVGNLYVDVADGGYINIGGIKIQYDKANGAIKVNGNLYATGGVSAYGDGTSSAGGSVLSSVAYSDSLKLTSEELDKVATAYSIAQLSSRIATIESGAVIGSVAWDDIINKPSTFAPSSHTHTFASLTGKPSTISGYGITDANITNGVITLGGNSITPLTAHQSLSGYVNAISVTGSGNAVTSVSKSGNTITLTKGASFLTSHQSLSNYYTKSEVGNIVGNYLPLSGGTISGLLKVSVGIDVYSSDKEYLGAIGFNRKISTGGRYNNDYDGWQIQNHQGLFEFITDQYGVVATINNSGLIYAEGGFNKSGSSDSYVLLGGGGHKTISSLSVSYASSAGSASSVAWSGVSGRPTALSSFTNDSGFITSSASISGNAGSATKLQTARSLWGNSFNGTANVNGRIVFDADTSFSANNEIGLYDSTLFLNVRNNKLSISKMGTNGLALDISELTTAYTLKVYPRDGHIAVIDTNNNLDAGATISSTYLKSQVDSLKLYAYNSFYRLAFLRSNGTEYWNMSLRQNSNDLWLYNCSLDKSIITLGLSKGFVGIDDTDPKAKLVVANGSIDVYDSTSDSYSGAIGFNRKSAIGGRYNSKLESWQIQNYNSTMCFYNDSYGTVIRIDSTGNLLTTGGITAYSSSDRKLKKDLAVMDSLSVIKSLGSVYSFTYRKSGERSIGLIAQNVQNSILSDLVAKDKEGYLKLNYWSPKLISLALGGVMQVDSEVNKLKRKVKKLEQVNQRLIMEVKQLKDKENKR